MDEQQRSRKRIIIIAIYVAIFFGVAFLIYLIAKPAPTCTDKKQNQGEQEIDCGGPCKACEEKPNLSPISLLETAFVPSGQGKYDVVAKIQNPNNGYGSSNFSYRFTLKDGNGNTLIDKTGTDYILPSETKYIIETGLDSNTEPQNINFSIDNLVWTKFSGYEKPQLNIYNKSYNLLSDGVGFSQVYGLLRNESSFDFNTIEVNIVLRDEASKIAALNKTTMNTVDSGEERDFKLIWPASFPGDVQNVESEANADVFNSQNFINKYLQGGKYQQY
jgi:hypothetical protein